MSIPVIVTAPNVYQIDTLLQLTGTFTRTDGVTPADPDAVYLFLQDPSGAVTEYSASTTPPVSRVSTGVYAFEIAPSVSGAWVYKWQGVGTIEVTSADVYFTVTPSAVIAG